jgi:hypothetical protein
VSSAGTGRWSSPARAARWSPSHSRHGPPQAIDLAVGERSDGPVFLAGYGRRLDRHGAARIVRRAAHRAQITKPVGPHTLRHAFITGALDAGVPLRDVQEAAWHADPRTTMRYDRAAAAWTGMPPTSSPLTSPVPPDKNAWQELRLAGPRRPGGGPAAACSGPLRGGSRQSRPTAIATAARDGLFPELSGAPPGRGVKVLVTVGSR